MPSHMSHEKEARTWAEWWDAGLPRPPEDQPLPWIEFPERKMMTVLNKFKTEPVALFALVEAIVGMLITLDVLSAEVGGSIGTVLAVLLGVGVRSVVSPVAKQ